MDAGQTTPTINLLNTFQTKSQNTWIRSICLTETDKLLVAVGYDNGTIELFDVIGDEAQTVQNFQSHRNKVNVLHFSPWHLSQPQHIQREPLILVSLSEEICFWNVTHALNNPIERASSQRNSQRFNRRSSQSAAIDLNGNTNQKSNGNFLHPNGTPYISNGHNTSNGGAIACVNDNWTNPWIGKCGSTQKPELLSCIKFVGSSAEKVFINKSFTKFITVDNEGEIYYLKTIDFRSDAIS